MTPPVPPTTCSPARPGGSYTIQAVYTDPLDFKTSTGTNTLIVAAAATTITPSNASTNFSATTGEGITLSANVSSAAGTINQGAVTFTILNSSVRRSCRPLSSASLTASPVPTICSPREPRWDRTRSKPSTTVRPASPPRSRQQHV